MNSSTEYPIKKKARHETDMTAIGTTSNNPTNDFKNEADIFNAELNNNIADKCFLLESDVDELANDPTQLMDVASVYAYLARISELCTKSTVVLSPQYSILHLNKNKKDENLPGARSLCYGDIENFENIIIPVYLSGHFVIGIYKINEAVTYFDPLGLRIQDDIRMLIRKAVADIGEGRITKSVRLYQAKEFTYNKQTDSINCGFHICLIAQNLLLKGSALVENFDIAKERERIIKVLYTLFPNNIQEDPNNPLFETSNYSSPSFPTKECSVALNKINLLNRQRRQQESKEMRTIRLLSDTQRHRESRENETEETRHIRIENDRITKQLRRSQQKEKLPRTFKIASHYDENNETYTLGSMNIECKHCQARHFQEERTKRNVNSFNDCCRHGKIRLEEYPIPPDYIRKLLNGEAKSSRHFFEHIRRINSNLSFGALAPVPEIITGKAPPCVRIHGQITYMLNKSLFPVTSKIPTHGQLYIVDSREALDYRHQLNPTVDQNLLQTLSDLMKEINPIAKNYKMMMDEYENLKKVGNNAEDKIILQFKVKEGLDLNRYNLPSTNEIAAVFVPTADSEVPDTSIVVQPKHTTRPNFFKSIDPLIDPMIYPIYFSYGTLGWDCKKMTQIDNNQKRISRAEYLSYRLFTRTNQFNVLHYGRDLFQMFCAEQSIRVLRDRIDFVRYNQKTLRSETYKNIDKHLAIQSEITGKPIGRKVILPSSITGTPRWEAEQFQDTMTILMRRGRPDLFITMTCNPSWPEIQANLLPGQKASDRPDIVARIFDLKKEKLMELITKDAIFGRPAAYVNVIEFQKRGLPHVHILLTLKKEDKIITADDIDKFIWAYLPDPNKYPKLYQKVAKHMLHGPHETNKSCIRLDPKTRRNKCRFNYPKDFNKKTTLNQSGYPSYARPDNGCYVEKPKGFKLDNRWVVPYNPFLLQYFDCHINVERVVDIKSIKYLYKYIYKGPDKAALSISINDPDKPLDHDECSRFIDGRYVSAPEGCWIILRKNLQEKSHAIVRLPVHLENEENVYWVDDPNLDEDELIESMKSKEMLKDYFKLNEKDQDACNYFYHEIPEHYIWNQKNRKWQRRKQSFNVLGRMQQCNPSEGERFYLRILLCHVKGAKSFNELREYDGTIHKTYKETALARGLIKDDAEWIRTLKEATIIMPAWQMRVTFARILVHCSPVKPKELWLMFKSALSEDFERQLFDKTKAERLAYRELAQLMKEEGKSLSHFPEMDQVDDFGEIEEIINKEEELDKAMQKYVILTDEQKQIIHAVLKRMEIDLPDGIIDEDDDPRNVFYVDGPGGTGKTTVYITLNHFLRGHSKKVCNMAHMGNPATLLPQGRTIHNRFGLPVPLYSDSCSTIRPSQKEWKELKETNAFIVDEISATPKHGIKIMHDVLTDATGNPLLFGGKIVLFGGDFRQTLPIQEHASPAQLMDLTVKGLKINDFPLWNSPSIRKFKLTRNLRADENEQEFAKFLLDIGEGRTTNAEDYVELPRDCICDGDLAEELFSSCIERKDWEELSQIAILAPLNTMVDEWNDYVMELLPQDGARTYLSIDKAETKQGQMDAQMFTLEYLHSLKPQGLPPHELKLRIHSIVMLTRNLNIKRGLSNGTRLEVLNLHDNFIEGRIITGDIMENNNVYSVIGHRAGEIEFIPRITLNCTEEYPFTLSRHQFPVRPAFAMTINKSQGQTLKRVGLDLRYDCFAHGQLYVALSRVRRWIDIKVYLNDPSNRFVKNIVYKDILEIDNT